MALLRADGTPFHSKILWIQEEDEIADEGRQFGWRPLVQSDTSAAFVDSSLIQVSFPDPEAHLFCSGHTQLSDGRLLVAGGTEEGAENGMRYSQILTPGAGTSGGSWSTTAAADSLVKRRWYPTAT